MPSQPPYSSWDTGPTDTVQVLDTDPAKPWDFDLALAVLKTLEVSDSKVPFQFTEAALQKAIDKKDGAVSAASLGDFSKVWSTLRIPGPPLHENINSINGFGAHSLLGQDSPFKAPDDAESEEVSWDSPKEEAGRNNLSPPLTKKQKKREAKKLRREKKAAQKIEIVTKKKEISPASEEDDAPLSPCPSLSPTQPADMLKSLLAVRTNDADNVAVRTEESDSVAVRIEGSGSTTVCSAATRARTVKPPGLLSMIPETPVSQSSGYNIRSQVKQSVEVARTVPVSTTPHQHPVPSSVGGYFTVGTQRPNPSKTIISHVPCPTPQYTSRTPYAVVSPQVQLTPNAHAGFQPASAVFPGFQTTSPFAQTNLSTPLVPSTPSRRSVMLNVRQRVERHEYLWNKLFQDFEADKKWLLEPVALAKNKTSADEIHVFVDASNIFIGFTDTIKKLQRVHPKARYQGPDISFEVLMLLMERRRPAAKRILSGSPPLSAAFATAEAAGYKVDVLDKVHKVQHLSEKKKFYKLADKHGWKKANELMSAIGNGPETGIADVDNSKPVWREQAVDEILQLHMCNSILDAEEPGTIVLATGDAAEGEYSDGFLKHVERALNKGWKVELVSWRGNMSGAYKNREFQRQWANRFTIIHLDEYVEELFDT
ncbi:hypothetical protein GQ43DRAFT_410580 [Delitschia confertaspora ATCC 74209]|uniref:NYN domain-containing protein n=1 Tax=Delitschia confertaspora ATCC 74209 TaxID=1513339 RepID=A0A9P4N1J3_9PLEO|nr:hypothetical protein GQ43DRAFT_410580 [Delitschia confertaspora ATCC 74209]